jgi:hypothetical protein
MFEAASHTHESPWPVFALEGRGIGHYQTTGHDPAEAVLNPLYAIGSGFVYAGLKEFQRNIRQQR